MRILHCIWRMAVGGAERQLLYLVDGLKRRGHEVHVALVFDGDFAPELEKSGTEIHRIAGHKRDPLVIARLVGLLRKLRPDVVNTWLTQMDIAAGVAAESLRIPWVLSERCSPGSYPPSALHSLRMWVGRRADAVIANSSSGADYWREARTRAPIHV